MISQALVSIVIPCYNQSHFLIEAIKSVKQQTYQNLEIIVVNDGSTDETSRVALSFENVILLEQNNQGLSASRNNGLKKCRGEFVVLLDSDDTLLPKALEIGVNLLNKCPNYVFVSGLSQLVDINGKLLKTIQPIPYSDDFYLSLLRSNFIWSPSNVMYRRELFEKIEAFDVTLNPTADYELYLRIAKEFPVFHHSSIVTNYRQHQTSMSKNYKMMLDSVLEVYERQRSFITNDKYYAKAFRYGISGYKDMYLEGIYYQFSQSLKNRKFKKACQNALILLSFPTKLPKLLLRLIRIKLRIISP